jgi:hypothetical protein
MSGSREKLLELIGMFQHIRVPYPHTRSSPQDGVIQCDELPNGGSTKAAEW